jgi:hypothetical protein
MNILKTIIKRNNMEELTKYVADNYNGLYEIYITYIDPNETTFDDFCMKMFIAQLKNK